MKPINVRISVVSVHYQIQQRNIMKVLKNFWKEGTIKERYVISVSLLNQI